MERRDLEYFAVVAEHGHLGRAAEALGLSTSALSKSLRRIEGSLQAKLVKRTPKGVELTAIGATLISHANRLRLSFDDIAREAGDLREGRVGNLRIGVSPGLAQYLLPQAVSAFLKTAPNATLNVTEANGTVELLRNGELDLVLVLALPHPEHGLIQEHLFDDEILVYASKNHRLARKKSVTLADIAQEHWALSAPNVYPMRFLIQKLEERGLPFPKVKIISNSIGLRYIVVGVTNLLSFSMRRVVHPIAALAELKNIPVVDFRCVWRVGVIYRKEAYISPLTKCFIEILKATAKEMVV